MFELIRFAEIVCIVWLILCSGWFSSIGCPIFIVFRMSGSSGIVARQFMFSSSCAFAGVSSCSLCALFIMNPVTFCVIFFLVVIMLGKSAVVTRIVFVSMLFHFLSSD